MSRVRRESEEMEQDGELPPGVNQPPVVNQPSMQQSKPGEYVLSGHSIRVFRSRNMLFLSLRCSSRNNLFKCALTIMMFLLVSKTYMCAVPNHVYINPCLTVISGLGKHVVTEYYRAKYWHKRYGE
jgi:hypothetical protein